jgi:4-amino-4-deoxy-L-arabinose transferase-like glycosyltransferase
VGPKSVLALIVVAYLLVGTLYAVKTPDWQVPDEPAHYNYIRQLAEERRLPVLESGDYDQDYLARLTSERFPPELSLISVEYEDWQPPLYYVLATPLYLLFDGALIPLRLFSLILGAGVIILAYAIVSIVFPDRPILALGTAAFVAFLPQHVAMLAGVNNDSLTELLIAAALLLLLLCLQDEERGNRGGGPAHTHDAARPSQARDASQTQSLKLVGLGLVLGLGLVTKASFVPIVLTVGVALLIVWWRESARTWRGLIRTLALVFLPALLIAAPWWLRNASTYGGFDIYGTANHDTVVVGQPRTTEWIQTYGAPAWLERWVTFTFQSFWGQFGWMGVLMPTWLYRALALWSAILLIGFLIWLREERNSAQHAARSTPLVILATVLLFVVVTYVYYNIGFVQHQGRYLFPALIPIALAVALAVAALLRFLRLPERLRPFAFAAPYLAMVALGLYALWRFILPALT